MGRNAGWDEVCLRGGGRGLGSAMADLESVGVAGECGGCVSSESDPPEPAGSRGHPSAPVGARRHPLAPKPGTFSVRWHPLRLVDPKSTRELYFAR